MIERDFDFLEAYDRARHQWRNVLFAILLGGLAGLVLSFLLPPLYRSTASLGIGIDYSRAFPLTRDSEEKALLQVQNLILSDDVLETTMELASSSMLERNNLGSVSDFKELIRLDRYGGRWDLSVSLRNPQDAVDLAQAWAEASTIHLASALEHALLVQELQSELFDLACERVPFDSGEGFAWACGEIDIASGSSLAANFVEEIEASHGIVPALTFSRLARASTPTEPLRAERPAMLIAGALIGGILGILSVTLEIPARLKWRDRS
jgi:hypothetical protein